MGRFKQLEDFIKKEKPELLNVDSEQFMDKLHSFIENVEQDAKLKGTEQQKEASFQEATNFIHDIEDFVSEKTYNAMVRIRQICRNAEIKEN